MLTRFQNSEFQSLFSDGHGESMSQGPTPFEQMTPAQTFGFSEGTQAAAEKRGLSAPYEMFDHFKDVAANPGDSANFQRELYELWTGQAAPENYTGFHASQADRIGNVVDADLHDVGMMGDIAVLATMLREMMTAHEEGSFPWPPHGGGYRPEEKF